ncbi:hypothetical protein H4R20_000624 [Coemansia guatemalensis]|uniref:Uncharacterized protein n=1 Tax=Coemansia guatemalensis TaxID=2761395 RepID=A0A9W8LWR6_9FUNG|nr:hypothetical protein H4R20_000624 [Coemansia guatemalensis]
MLAAKFHDCFEAVEAQELELGTLDLATFGVNVDGFYIYQNTAQESGFMSLDRIARSFCKVAADYYPMLLGRPAVNHDGKAVIVVDPDNINMPDIAEVFVDHPIESFIETSKSDVKGGKDIRFFNKHKFYESSGVARLPHATYNQDDAAAIVRVIRFKNNDYVALYIALTHVLFDGTGATIFFNHWAEYSRNIDTAGYRLETPPVNDRSVVREYFDKVTATDPPFLKHMKECSATPPMASPANIAPILMATPDMPGFEQQHLLHISAAKLEQLRQDVDKSQTTNLVLAALLTKSMALVNMKEFKVAPKWTYVMFPFDCRQRTEIPAKFSGNLSVSAIAPLDSRFVLDGSYKDIALAIKDHCSKTTSDYAKSTILTIEKELHILYQAGISLRNSHDTSYVGLTNLRYMPLYTIDFGYGGPELLSCDYYIRDGMMRIYPNKQDGGIDLVMNYNDKLFQHLDESSDLLQYADVIY